MELGVELELDNYILFVKYICWNFGFNYDWEFGLLKKLKVKTFL